MNRVDIIIFGGQSNMQGQSERLSDVEVVPAAREYRFLQDALIPLRNPVGENISNDATRGEDVTPQTDLADWLARHALGASCYGNTNLVPAFCRAYTQQTGGQVVAVHAAKGSTTIGDWLPGSRGYEVLRKKACAAIACAKREGCEIGGVYFVWLQGESDAIFATPRQVYRRRLRLLADALHTDVGTDIFGIIRVGRFVGDARDDEIIAAQDEACAEYADFEMLTDIATTLNTQPIYMNPTVAGHYSAAGLEALGQAAGNALARLSFAREETKV